MLSRDCRHRLGSTVGGAASSDRNPYGSRLQTVRPVSDVISAFLRVPRNPREASSKSRVSENGSAARVAACCSMTDAEASLGASPLNCCVTVFSPCLFLLPIRMPLSRWPENNAIARGADDGKIGRFGIRERVDRFRRNRVRPEMTAGKARQRLAQQIAA